MSPCERRTLNALQPSYEAPVAEVVRLQHVKVQAWLAAHPCGRSQTTHRSIYGHGIPSPILAPALALPMALVSIVIVPTSTTMITILMRAWQIVSASYICKDIR